MRQALQVRRVEECPDALELDVRGVVGPRPGRLGVQHQVGQPPQRRVRREKFQRVVVSVVNLENAQLVQRLEPEKLLRWGVIRQQVQFLQSGHAPDQIRGAFGRRERRNAVAREIARRRAARRRAPAARRRGRQRKRQHQRQREPCHFSVMVVFAAFLFLTFSIDVVGLLDHTVGKPMSFIEVATGSGNFVSADDAITRGLLNLQRDDSLKPAFDLLASNKLDVGPELDAIEKDVRQTAARMERKVVAVTLAGRKIFG